MTAYETLRLERRDDGTALATLDRPERLNAMTFQMLDELAELQLEIAADPEIRALVITGEGRGFCAGLDLDDAERLARMGPLEAFEGQQGWSRAVAGFRLGPTPVIAAVNGPAAGAGLGLVLAADVAFAAPTATFTAAFVRIGLHGGDVGVSWMLPRLVGIGMASEMMLSGRQVEAEEAGRAGLVNRILPAERLLDEALKLAAEIASHSPAGVRMTKRVLQQNVDAPSLEAALETENRGQIVLVSSDDMSEALQAFRAKRPPQFSGR